MGNLAHGFRRRTFSRWLNFANEEPPEVTHPHPMGRNRRGRRHRPRRRRDGHHLRDHVVGRSSAAQTTVVGVHSTAPAFLGGQPVDGDPTDHVPLAVVGVVPVKVSAEKGAIAPGDLLVSASVAGHAMRAGADPAMGTVIGKALQPLAGGTGMITALIVLQ